MCLFDHPGFVDNMTPPMLKSQIQCHSENAIFTLARRLRSCDTLPVLVMFAWLSNIMAEILVSFSP